MTGTNVSGEMLLADTSTSSADTDFELETPDGSLLRNTFDDDSEWSRTVRNASNIRSCLPFFPPSDSSRSTPSSTPNSAYFTPTSASAPFHPFQTLRGPLGEEQQLRLELDDARALIQRLQKDAASREDHISDIEQQLQDKTALCAAMQTENTQLKTMMQKAAENRRKSEEHATHVENRFHSLRRENSRLSRSLARAEQHARDTEAARCELENRQLLRADDKQATGRILAAEIKERSVPEWNPPVFTSFKDSLRDIDIDIDETSDVDVLAIVERHGNNSSPLLDKITRVFDAYRQEVRKLEADLATSEHARKITEKRLDIVQVERRADATRRPKASQPPQAPGRRENLDSGEAVERLKTMQAAVERMTASSGSRNLDTNEIRRRRLAGQYEEEQVKGESGPTEDKLKAEKTAAVTGWRSDRSAQGEATLLVQPLSLLAHCRHHARVLLGTALLTMLFFLVWCGTLL